MTVGWLDWRNHSVGPALPCRICSRPAICRDEHDRPCHKVCAEQQPADAEPGPDALVVDLAAYTAPRGPATAPPGPRKPDEEASAMPVPNVAGLRAAALSAAARGWHVFPVRPGDKRPAFPDHAEADCIRADPRCRAGHTGWEPRAATDPDRIGRAWQRIPYNVGIACGPACLVVIDLDMPKPGTVLPPEWVTEGVRDGADVFAVLCERAGQPFPNTYTVTTASGGTHLYFLHPEHGPALRNTRGDAGRGLGPLIDTRAHGGLVVAAGSIVGGQPYTVLCDTDPEPLPLWLAEQLYPEPPRPAVPVVLSADRAGRYVQAAIDRTLAKLAEASEGGRNDTLWMAAQSLGQLAAGGALTDEQVTDALEPAARALGLTARETARTIRSGLTAGARHPRSVAA